MKSTIETLEIVTIYTENKLPYVGILFENEFTAQRANQSWVNENSEDEYELYMEVSKGNSLTVNLIKLPTRQTYSYLVSRYDDEKLNFFAMCANWNGVNFGHVVKENGKFKAVRTAQKNKLYVLKVKKVEYQRMFK
jgi:hypothetical protein